MSFVSITPPAIGTPTKASFAQAVVDNLNDLNNRITSGNDGGIPNGSFEKDSDSNGTPDSWVKTLYTGGSFAITGNGLADTECAHGARAIKFTHPGGANGGGYVDTENFIEVTPNRSYAISYLIRVTNTNLATKLEVVWYDAAQALISTVTPNNESATITANNWIPRFAALTAPSTARYAKVRLIGGHTSLTVAGSVYFDNVTLTTLDFFRRVEFYHDYVTPTSSLAIPFVAPVTGVYRVHCFGGGGGGGGGSAGSFSAGGGGSGEYAVKCVRLTQDTSYTITIGGGGTAGTSAGSDGGNGLKTSFSTLVEANGGIGGKPLNNGSGQAGGSGSTLYDFQINGNKGADYQAGNVGGHGGHSVNGLPGGLGTTGAGAAPAQRSRGAGGSGKGRTSGAVDGGRGDPGCVIIEW